MNAALPDPGPQATAQVRRFAFKGRVSTEDNQDPEASRNWQISRSRALMAAQAAVEGRFLGGRPPYGYRIADAGPHPNPAKAADGRRLHKLEPDPQTAWVIRRIFAEYLAGRGLFAIAEGLTRDRVPSPSQHDAARNTHRTGEGWAKSAVRAILRNPRYTGRQVW